MKTINTELVDEFAGQLAPLLPEARKANTGAESARAASKQVDELLLDYVDRGGNMTHLAEQLEGKISLAGLRRRHRAANAKRKLEAQGITSWPSSARGSQDSDRVARAAAAIREAQASGVKGAYGNAVREHVVLEKVSMGAVAKELGRDYYALYTAATSSV